MGPDVPAHVGSALLAHPKKTVGCSTHRCGPLGNSGSYPTNVKTSRQSVEHGYLDSYEAGTTHLHPLNRYHHRATCTGSGQVATHEAAGQGPVGDARGRSLRSTDSRAEVAAPNTHPGATGLGGSREMLWLLIGSTGRGRRQAHWRL